MVGTSEYEVASYFTTVSYLGPDSWTFEKVALE